MDAHTIHQKNSPGWRALVEGLYTHIEAARERETALLRIVELDHMALARVRGNSRPSPVSSAQAPRQSTEIHKQILAVLEQHPEGCTLTQIEAALGNNRLGDVLDGLAKRVHIVRLGQGPLDLPGHNETSRTAKTKE
jgi:hypothetical protein